ncbi:MULTISPECIES: TIGR00730 family Rossman fold protein [unclassified Methylobacterium]|uniref:LOG family protein n=1 Tax=unclassified Methylobacterium TaxID=2615210 RepID=UPI0011C1FA4F|nr:MULTISPECIES: TIGR00730 family Rossman fold protein [unclassified Methylobacterium]QEE38466.1 TIGR00730 family Rossman fold protein [Methylobacterium sp. WL1]TXN03465.1 TIGR00730 family Rossman fold protein [Methylobacterium sp. WL64]TXN56551.1 TIGR00730 family Rossman fold protein [Methylobacterium sp. WL2]
MAPVRTVCVYCGSGFGGDPAFRAAAETLGTAIAQAGMGLVYGGGDVGLMGAVARAALAAGGHVTGIIPDFLQAREHMLDDVQETIVVSDMHTRKRLMFERSDAFVTLPGGIGTLEELVEQLTWAQLGQHRKPVVLVSVADFWAPLLDLFEHMRRHGFIRAGLDLSYTIARDAAAVVPLLREAGHEPDPQAEETVKERM